MKKLVYLVVFIVFLPGCFNGKDEQLTAIYSDGDKLAESLIEGEEQIEFLYKQQRGGVMVTSIGRITKLLENQITPYPAQMVLVRLSSGRKLLIKHNIDKGQPLPELQLGEMLTFSGIYRWNAQGGMILSTYQQAKVATPSGWIKYQDVLYQ